MSEPIADQCSNYRATAQLVDTKLSIKRCYKMWPSSMVSSGYSFSTYAKYFEKLLFLSFAVSFTENFAYVKNE